MTHEEFRKVAEICSNADDGCQVCVRSLFRALYKEFGAPGDGTDEILDEIWCREFYCEQPGGWRRKP